MSRGFALLETLFAVAVLSVAAAACFFIFTALGRFAAHQIGPAHEAAALLAEQTLRDAEQAWKYGSPGTVPQGTAVSGPFTINVSTSNVSPGGATIDAIVRYAADPGHQDSGSVEVRGQAIARAPLPGSQLARPGLVPAPSPSPCC